jgi:hypothetical protein
MRAFAAKVFLVRQIFFACGALRRRFGKVVAFALLKSYATPERVPLPSQKPPSPGAPHTSMNEPYISLACHHRVYSIWLTLF